MQRNWARVLIGVACMLIVGLGLADIAAAEVVPVVKAIVVRGNEHVDTSLIQSAITKTQIGKPAKEQDIVDDIHAIFGLGYFYDAGADVDPVSDTEVQISFWVDEHPVVHDIVFKGATKAPVDQYIPRMRIKKGDVFNANQMVEDLNKMPDWMLAEHGIALRPVDLEVEPNGVVFITVVETTLKDIEIRGNKKTRDYVIQRELTISPGDVVNLNEVNRSLRRVFMLGYFNEINRHFEDGANRDETTLVIEVDERKTATATFGVTYSSQDGIIGFVDVADENFLGRGQRLNAQLQYGKGIQTYELGFFEPYIDKKGTSIGANLYKRSTDVSMTLPPEDGGEELTGERSVIGGDISLGRRITDNTRLSLTLRAQNIAYKQDGDVPSDDWYEDYNTRTISLGARTDTTDHPFNPTEGFKNDASLELGVGFLGGDSQFSKIKLSHSRYFEVREGGYIFALRGTGGRVLTGEVQENEKFRVGGDDSIRGYTRGSDDSLVGDKMLVVNAEFRFPIVEKIQGVVFTDWGRAWDENEDITLTDLKNSYGLGVRLDTPLGLLRLDYGLGLDEEDNRKGQFYFGIGQTF